MNKAAMDIILKALQPIFTEQGMKRQDGEEEIFVNDKKAAKVWYDEKRSLFKLDVAEVAEGESVNFDTVSSWLFDDAHNERDATAIASDFAESLNSSFGIKKTRSNAEREVSLPSKATPGNTPGIEAFTQRFLTLFPQFKDTYKNDVALYGDFLYEDFFSKTAAVHLRTLVQEKNKKQLGKFFEMLDEFYIDGDYTVQSIITYTIIGGAFGEDRGLFEQAQEYMQGAVHLKVPSRAMLDQVIRKEKRGRSKSK